MQVYATHWTGTDGGLPAPVPLFRRTMPIADGAITVPIGGASYRDAFLLLVAPEGKAPRWTEPVPHWTVRLEAEDAARKGARPFPVRMNPSNFFANTVSGDSYVGLLDRSDVSLIFSVTVPAAGDYDLSFGYSNGLADTASYLVAVNNGAPVPIRFTPTQFRELIDQSDMRVKLPAGASTITLSAAPNSPKGSLLPSLIEIDYIDVTAAD